MSNPLPSNVHVSSHPCLRAKLSQLRSSTTDGRSTKHLIHEIALILGCEALSGCLDVTEGARDKTPLGYTYTTEVISPQRISLVPILRSGLGMVEAIQTLLPSPVAVHHLGLFRDPISLQPVEYYNNLPDDHHHHRPTPAPPPNNANNHTTHLAILLDPIVATGGTSTAAIQTLHEWDPDRIKIVLICILASSTGIHRAAREWSEGVEIYVGAIDDEEDGGEGRGGIDERGMIRPGLGDVGDRLFLTIGK